jgi:holin-like protein
MKKKEHISMMKLIRLTGQLAILGGVFWLGTEISERSGLPIPGSVLGVVILFFLLLSGLIKLKHVEEVADILLKHLMFFFIPISVGLMNAADIFLEHGWILLLAIIISALTTLWVTGNVTQLLRKRQGECKL